MPHAWLPGAVARAVAPLWPLRSFVAVNPFLGLADRPFEEAATVLARAAGARLTMPRTYYASQIASGRITARHITEAIGRIRSLPPSVNVPFVLERAAAGDARPIEPFPTVAAVAGSETGRSLERFLCDRLSAWAAGYFDEGQAAWQSPWKSLRPYAAWHAEASRDRTPDVVGVAGWRAAVAAFPSDPDDAASQALAAVDVPQDLLDLYLHRLLRSIGGWVAFARQQGWPKELQGGSDDAVGDLLLARLVADAALLATAPGLGPAWRTALERARSVEPSSALELAVDLVLQHAHEAAWHEDLRARLAAAPEPPAEGPRPRAQAVFCIDVRSEVFRRALEAVDPAVETLGFAGFFGFPIEYVRFGLDGGHARCPVLLTPRAAVRETVAGVSDARATALAAARNARRRAAVAWKAFKTGAISCFSFVGPLGLLYAPRLVTDGFGLTRPVPHPSLDGVAPSLRGALGPALAPGRDDGRPSGLPPGDRVAMAEAALRGMSLTGGFSRLVLLVGHGSTSVNNPHASGLDCGACGGHAGDANARVAASVLNDPDVRKALGRSGLHVPDHTVFLAALHDTTTDDVRLFETDHVPASHRDDLARLTSSLEAAGRLARAERAPRLGLPAGPGADAALRFRSRDWSQVRPEWGLAGCAAFIAAPRSRTVGVNLGGRAFLHSYDWTTDPDFRVLELILTAPVVVASWINLQYYGSTVDNEAFGSGNKTLHNVVGTLGVLEGSGGGLRTGLPWQSIHDGRTFAHEPVRLTVAIEAPVDAIARVLEAHPGVRALADNGWIWLWALDAQGRVSHIYRGMLQWEGTASAGPAPVARVDDEEALCLQV
ncbi:MAG: YbcC family protein [Vicinamibacterales bacterium]